MNNTVIGVIELKRTANGRYGINTYTVDVLLLVKRVRQIMVDEEY